MQTATPLADNDTLMPIRQDERIQALDVVRGCALFGIFLMNVEWFNRPIAELELGLPPHASGLDYLAGWAIYVFVRGKFWTMFSLLFGMGFAVMLGRAERAGRDFVVPYLRRIAALAIFGIAHYVLVWTGDILFSYALGAGALMLVFYAPPLLFVVGIALCLMFAIALQADALTGIALALAVSCLTAAFIRNHVFPRLDGSFVPLAAPLLGLLAVVLIVIGISENLFGALFAGLIAALLAWLAVRFGEPLPARTWRAGAAIYLTPFLAMALSGAVGTYAPQLRPAPSAERQLELQKARDQQAADAREETAVMTNAAYVDAVAYRARVFSREAGNDVGFAIIVLGMFLIGIWFVRSGVMTDTAANLDFFRRMAWYGLPVGIGLSLLSTTLAVSNIPGHNDARYEMATGLLTLANLPACLGYVGVIVLMLHARGPLSRIAVVAPAGRMALTNYLGQSLLQSVFFYGCFLGHWGLARSGQVLFVIVVYAVQVVSSRWWLAKFRYGPMEWLWRAATYWQLPAMRRTTGC